MPLVDNSEAKDRSSFRLRRIGTPATFPGISDSFKINKEVTIVGRNPSSSDIFLDSNKNKVMISRLHARIVTEKDDTGKQTFRISDTSLNGTYVNDVKIANSCDLNPGDTVTFGHLRGAVLAPGARAEQPNSEFRFQFETYPSTPPNKKQKTSEAICSSPEFQRKAQTPSPQVLKPGSKTPLFPAALLPNLSAFLTPGTPSHSAPSPSTDKSRLPDSIHGKQTWRQHFVSESSDSEHSDDDLKAYAAAAGEAMEDSDEDIFSVQLPDSPESYDEPGTSSFSESVRASIEVKEFCQRFAHENDNSSTRSTVKEQKPPKKASKRPTKRTLTYKKAAQKSSRSSTSGDSNDNFMYNTCASVDCIHPHDIDKLVDWVQCDDCDDWYHVKCTGLTLKSVQPKSAKFHCGCV
ncbi:uncharacterized protein LOC144658207 isoform X2 [Oculina patagonica]